MWSAGVVVGTLFGLLASTTRAEQRVYWCDGSAIPASMDRVNLDGVALETFVTTPCFGHPVVDAIFTRDLFFVDAPSGNNINRVSVDGGAVSGFITFAGNKITGLTLEPGVNGPMYFVGNAGGTGSIWRANLDGTNITFIRNTASFV